MNEPVGSHSVDREDGQGEDRAFLNVQIVHSSPGRMRLKLTPIDFESVALRTAADALRRLSGVQEVRPNPLASSLVISYDPDELEEDELFAPVAQAGVEIVPVEAQPVRPLGDRSVGDVIAELFSTADQRVYDQANGQVDLRTLVPIWLAFLGVRELLAGRRAPAPWYTLFWYSFNTFTRLRKSGPPNAPPRE